MLSSSYDKINLELLGVQTIFGFIDIEMAEKICEFIIKTNLIQKELTYLTLFIHSSGGDVNDGFAIIDMIESSRHPIQTVGTGLIASTALLILSAGQKGTRTITKNTEIMSHQFSGGIEGKMHEMMAVTTEYQRLEQLFINHFKKHTKMTEKQIKDILLSPSDRWLSPIECKKFGLCDKI